MQQTIVARAGLKVMNTVKLTKGRIVRRQLASRIARAAFATALIAAASALPGMAVAGAANWDGINRDIGKLLLYMDRAGITHEGNTAKAWLLFDFYSPQSVPVGFKQYQSVKDL